MLLDLDDAETRALLNLLTEAIENDRYPLSPRVQMYRRILAKFGPIGALPHYRQRGRQRRKSAIRGERHGGDDVGPR
jgi:hypothetical protein